MSALDLAVSPSRDLSDLILGRLKTDATVTALVGGRVYDGPPADATFPYISFGPSDFADLSGDLKEIREETFQVDVWSRDQGKLWPVRTISDVVRRSLHLYAGTLTTHALVEMRAELRTAFLDRDGLTGHGIVIVSALIEEN